MQESVWAWWFVVLGIIIIAVVMLVTDMTTTSEQNYHMVKEISEASMMEAVDYAYYRKYGDLRINHEKFMENFIRRYSDVVTINKTSTIAFYDSYETPPKITVEVSTRSTQIIINYKTTDFDIKNRLDAILEMYSTTDPTTYNGLGTNSSSLSTAMPDENINANPSSTPTINAGTNLSSSSTSTTTRPNGNTGSESPSSPFSGYYMQYCYRSISAPNFKNSRTFIKNSLQDSLLQCNFNPQFKEECSREVNGMYNGLPTLIIQQGNEIKRYNDPSVSDIDYVPSTQSFAYDYLQNLDYDNSFLYIPCFDENREGVLCKREVGIFQQEICYSYQQKYEYWTDMQECFSQVEKIYSTIPEKVY